MTIGPVDLVYLWCDDTDAAWRAKREATAARFNVGASGCRNGACRYRGGWLLARSLRSVERFASWVRSVFVVVDDDQSVPDWPELKSDKVRIIRHSQIIPRDFLPTFDATVIEHYLARIPGLADRYLIANDDTFFVRPTGPEFFFGADGYPVFRFGRRRGETEITGESDYHATLDNAEAVLGVGRGNYPHHNIDAYCRPDVVSCFEQYREEIERRNGFPFRDAEKIHRLIYARYALMIGHGHFRRALFNTASLYSFWRRLLPAWADTYQLTSGNWRECSAAIRRFCPYLVCFNDGPRTTDADFGWLDGFLKDLGL